MKKLISVLMAVLMLISILSVAVFAEDIQGEKTEIYDYLCFDPGEGSLNIQLNGVGDGLGWPTITLQYSFNLVDWNDYSFDYGNSGNKNAYGDKIPTTGNPVYFRGIDNESFGCNTADSYYWFTWNLDAPVEVSGNIMMLLDFDTPLAVLTPYCFWRMFSGCTYLTSVPELSATSLAPHCYDSMFSGTSITVAPELNATTLADYCYMYMFNSCTELKEVPVLPATEMISGCYWGMFNGCTSLAVTPDLPATSLADGCYCSMFEGCTELITSPALPATELKWQCYKKMFSGCTALTQAPALFIDSCGPSSCSEMFKDCVNLQVTEMNDRANWVFAVSLNDFWTDWNDGMIDGTKGTLQEVEAGKSYFAGVHSHNWDYKLKDKTTDTIIAVCKGYGNCDYTGTDKELTISGINKTYDGKVASVELSATTFAGQTDLPDIVYQSLDKNGEPDKILSSAPVNTGVYRVSIIIDEAAAYSDYAITPRPLFVEGTTVNSKVYDGTTEAGVAIGTLIDAVDGDDIGVVVETAHFADAEAGKGKNVTVVYSVSGNDSANYSRPADATLTADIYSAAACISKGGKTINYKSVQDAVDASESDGTIKMIADSKECLYIKKKGAITLDLNGHTLSGSGDGNVITTYSDLTIKDSTPERLGKITGGVQKYSGDGRCGGGIFAGNCMLFIESGNICGNNNQYGGGVYVRDGTFIMTGGKITGNSATYGGGVSLEGKSNFIMTGGEISGNKAEYGGGVEYYNDPNSHITLGGNAVIFGNTLVDGTTINNLHLYADSNPVIISNELFTESAKIGVTLANGTGTFTTTADGDYSSAFISDNSNYIAICNGNGIDRIIKLVTLAEVTILKIDAIGDVEYTDSCEAKLDDARKAYDALTDEQKALITATQLKALTDAESEYASLKTAYEKAVADKAAADEVIAKINGIGDVKYTDSCKANIADAREAYNALTDDQKALVTDEQVKLITDAETEYAKLKNAVETEPEPKTLWDYIRQAFRFLWDFLTKFAIPLVIAFIEALF